MSASSLKSESECLHLLSSLAFQQVFQEKQPSILPLHKDNPLRSPLSISFWEDFMHVFIVLFIGG
jgi:hypothetical protein